MIVDFVSSLVSMHLSTQSLPLFTTMGEWEVTHLVKEAHLAASNAKQQMQYTMGQIIAADLFADTWDDEG